MDVYVPEGLDKVDDLNQLTNSIDMDTSPKADFLPIASCSISLRHSSKAQLQSQVVYCVL